MEIWWEEIRKKSIKIWKNNIVFKYRNKTNIWISFLAISYLLSAGKRFFLKIIAFSYDFRHFSALLIYTFPKAWIIKKIHTLLSHNVMRKYVDVWYISCMKLHVRRTEQNPNAKTIIPKEGTENFWESKLWEQKYNQPTRSSFTLKCVPITYSLTSVCSDVPSLTCILWEYAHSRTKFILSNGINAIQIKHKKQLDYSSGNVYRIHPYVCTRITQHLHLCTIPFYSCDCWFCGQIIWLSVHSVMEFNLLTAQPIEDRFFLFNSNQPANIVTD